MPCIAGLRHHAGMAHILTFPGSARPPVWRSAADTVEAGGSPAPTRLLSALDALLDGLRSAWWDGSSLGLSRGGLEALVGLEPGDATPRRRASA